MTVLSWSRCRNRSYSVFWSLLLITSAMSIKRLMSRCVVTCPDVITNAKPIPGIPRRRGLPKRLLYLRSIYVENKWLLTFCYNVLICRLFIVLSLATDIVSKDLGYLQNRFQEPTVEPETRCACHGELVLWSQNWQGKLLSVLCRTKKEARLCMDVDGRSA